MIRQRMLLQAGEMGWTTDVAVIGRLSFAEGAKQIDREITSTRRSGGP